MKIANSPICTFCNNERETIIHLFCNCNIVENLWNEISTWMNRKLNCEIKLDNKLIILGYLNMDKLYYSINTIILVAKSYIFKCSRRDITPNMIQFHNRLLVVLREQESIAIKNGNLQMFNKKLGMLL